MNLLREGTYVVQRREASPWTGPWIRGIKILSMKTVIWKNKIVIILLGLNVTHSENWKLVVWVCDQPKGRWRSAVTVCSNRALSKELPGSISGSEWSLGGLNSQRLSGFTDDFCACFRQGFAPWKQGAAILMLSLHRGHLGLCDICQDWRQMTSVVWLHYVSGNRVITVGMMPEQKWWGQKCLWSCYKKIQYLNKYESTFNKNINHKLIKNKTFVSLNQQFTTQRYSFYQQLNLWSCTFFYIAGIFPCYWHFT